MRVTVQVEAWQQECCGTPFAVGDVVRWRLVADSGWAARALEPQLRLDDVELLVEAVYGMTGDEPVGCRLGLGALQVFLGEDPPPAPGELRTVGLLCEDHHVGAPARLPLSPGTVASIRTLHRAYDEHGEPVPATSVLTHVHRVDRGLRDLPRRHLVGLLVELDVDTG